MVCPVDCVSLWVRVMFFAVDKILDGAGQGRSAPSLPVAPVAYQVILEPIGQFCEFEPPRVHTPINSWGLFLVHELTSGKRESVS